MRNRHKVYVLTILILMFLLLNPSYASMRSAKDLRDDSGGQRAFVEKYKGYPDEGYLIRNVPFYKQKDKNYCGPDALLMVMNYWEGEGAFSQEKIASSIFDEEIEITNNSDMVFYPQSKGFLVSSFKGDFEKLKSIIKKNIPVIVLQQVVSKVVKKGHYRVVIGYDESKQVIILHDPWLGSNLSMSYKTFLDLWDFGRGINKYNWTLIVLPKNKKEVFYDIIGENALTYHNMATALYNRNRVREAIKEWEKAIDLDPTEPTFYYCIAYAYIKKAMYDRAIHYAKKAVELDNYNSFCYDTLGWAYYKKGMLDEAWQNLNKAIKISPDTDFIKEHYDVVREEMENG